MELRLNWITQPSLYWLFFLSIFTYFNNLVQVKLSRVIRITETSHTTNSFGWVSNKRKKIKAWFIHFPVCEWTLKPVKSEEIFFVSTQFTGIIMGKTEALISFTMQKSSCSVQSSCLNVEKNYNEGKYSRSFTISAVSGCCQPAIANVHSTTEVEAAVWLEGTLERYECRNT